MSPGWQSNASQIPHNVEKRIAFTWPFFSFDKLTFETPVFSASSFKDIFLSAITLSNLKIISPIITDDRLCSL